jgi:hypothetical protein
MASQTSSPAIRGTNIERDTLHARHMSHVTNTTCESCRCSRLSREPCSCCLPPQHVHQESLHRACLPLLPASLPSESTTATCSRQHGHRRPDRHHWHHPHATPTALRPLCPPPKPRDTCHDTRTHPLPPDALRWGAAQVQRRGRRASRQRRRCGESDAREKAE